MRSWSCDVTMNTTISHGCGGAHRGAVCDWRLYLEAQTKAIAVVNSVEASAYRVQIVTDIVSEDVYRLQSGDRADDRIIQLSLSLQVDVQIALDPIKAMRLIPAQSCRIVTGPDFKASDATLLCQPLRLSEQSTAEMPTRRRSGCTARCHIMPPRARGPGPAQTVHTEPGVSSHSTSITPTIVSSSSATSSIAGWSYCRT
jgi:hypothetical protein